jgi:serine/threonine protein kinase
MKIPFGERYRILEELSRDSCFTTCLCFDEAYGLEVEVDDIDLEKAQPAHLIERLRQVLDACQKLCSRYTAPLLDWCEEEGHIYLIRERTEGQSLADILRETGELPGRQVAEIARAITEALAEAYGRGIFYLGLNPEQLRVDARGVAKLVRAGYAWIMEELDPTLSARVSPYRAPETDGSVEGARISDIYSLALMIKGMLPPGLASQRLRLLLERCLEPMPSNRPSSPRLLLEELEASLGGYERHEPQESASPQASGQSPLDDDVGSFLPPVRLSLDKPPPRRRMRTLLFILAGGLALWLLFAASSGFLAVGKNSQVPVAAEEKQTITLPDLEGLPSQEAQDILKSLGLIPELREAPSRLWSAGVVAAQEPATGSALSDGDSVYLSISTGSDETQPTPTPQPAAQVTTNDANTALPVNSSVPNPNIPDSSKGDSQSRQPVPQPPKAVASLSTRRGSAPLYVVLDASSSYDPDGRIVRYIWNCGDGTVLEGASAQHVFDPPVIPARFQISLQIFDSQGLTASSSLSLEVY